MAVEAEKHAHLKDNEYLLGKIARLTDAIWEYGEHRPSCRVTAGKECDCGFFEVIKSLDD